MNTSTTRNANTNANTNRHSHDELCKGAKDCESEGGGDKETAGGA